MIHYLYILASLSLFYTALGAATNATDAGGPAEGFVVRRLMDEKAMYVYNMTCFAITLPTESNMTINDSKQFGKTGVFHSDNSTTDKKNELLEKPGKNTSDRQYELPKGFFETWSISKQGGKNDAGFTQLTGCINMSKAPQFDRSDKGGVYGSWIKDRPLAENMNLTKSSCDGFKGFVECVQPNNGQFVLRCCNDHEDCPSPSDRQRCSDVMPGDYGACSEAKN